MSEVEGAVRQAPRFHAFVSRLERRQVLLMPRSDWNRLAQIAAGEIVEIDLSATPISRVARSSHVEAVIALRHSPSEVTLEVFRNDPNDAPTPINVERYRVWERPPAHWSYLDIVNAASTEDNANMRGFLDDHVFLVKDTVQEGHWLAELPSRVRAVLRRSGA